jgi:beta-glucosidase
VPNAEGRIEDTDRVMYLRNHITNVQRAAAEGYPIKGYFLWSLLDNFEWGDGYSKRLAFTTWTSRPSSARPSSAPSGIAT